MYNDCPNSALQYPVACLSVSDFPQCFYIAKDKMDGHQTGRDTTAPVSGCCKGLAPFPRVTGTLSVWISSTAIASITAGSATRHSKYFKDKQYH